jgi:hypothetical protein
MPVAIRQTAPVDLKTYDQVDNALGLDDTPPEGMILHTAGAVPDGVAIFDIWESEEAYQTFREQKLLPAIAKVAGDEAAQGGPPEDQVIYEVHHRVGV